MQMDRRTFGKAALALLLSGCAGSGDIIPSDTPPLPQVTLLPTPTQSTPLAKETAPTATSRPRAADIYNGQWQTPRPGIEVLQMIAQVNQRDEAMTVARITPQQTRVQVRYAQTAPKRVREWYLAEEADLVINGGYYSPENQALGLLIMNRKSFGQSYRGFGGMFSMRNRKPSLQWLKTQPYRADAAIDFALQCFPMLVTRGRVVEGIQDNGEQNRRSFVALDRRGRVLFGITQAAQWTLTDLSQYLQQASQFEIVEALNLDGGASTGLWIRGMDDARLTDSFDEVPAVITVKV